MCQLFYRQIAGLVGAPSLYVNRPLEPRLPGAKDKSYFVGNVATVGIENRKMFEIKWIRNLNQYLLLPRVAEFRF